MSIQENIEKLKNIQYGIAQKIINPSCMNDEKFLRIILEQIYLIRSDLEKKND